MSAMNPQSITIEHLSTISQLIDEDILTGCVIAALDTNASRKFCRGYDRPATMTDRVVLDETTMFNVGSVTKCITGTLLAQTVADGLIKLDIRKKILERLRR